MNFYSLLTQLSRKIPSHLQPFTDNHYCILINRESATSDSLIGFFTSVAFTFVLHMPADCASNSMDIHLATIFWHAAPSLQLHHTPLTTGCEFRLEGTYFAYKNQITLRTSRDQVSSTVATTHLFIPWGSSKWMS